MSQIRRLLLFILLFSSGLFPGKGFSQQWYIDSIKLLLQNNPSDDNRADFYLKLAKSYRNLNTQLAMKYADSCLELAGFLKNRKLEAEVINETGVLYRKMDMYVPALEKHQDALIRFETLGDKMGIAYALANIGNVYQALEQYDKSLDFNLQSLKLKRELGDDDQLAYALRTTGLAYLYLKKHEQASMLFQEALDLYKKIGDLYGVGNLYYHLGNVAYQRDFDKTLALEYYEKALEIYNSLQNQYGTALSKYEKAKTHMEMGHNEIAKQLFAETISSMKKAQSPKLLMDVYREFSIFYKKQADYQNALYYFEKYATIRDSLYSENTSRNIAEMQTKYDTNKKQNQIDSLKNEQKLHTAYQLFFILAIIFISSFGIMVYLRYRDKKKTNSLLEKEIEIRKKKESELLESQKMLTEANATKDKFFSIISHDLKNPFGAILGMAELLEDDYETLSDEDRIQIIQQIFKSAQHTYSLLDDLLAWSRAQRGLMSFNPIETDVLSLCRENIDFISSAALRKNIQIDCTVPSGVKIVADQNMLTSIVRNLLSNAVKFSYPGGKVVVSSCKFTENTTDEPRHFFEITVKDNGVGINPENQKKLFRIEEKFKSYGTLKESGNGLGLIICKEFVEIHGGRMKVASEPGKGSLFGFILPVNPLTAACKENIQTVE